MPGSETPSAADALARLLEGNARLVRGAPLHSRTTRDVLAGLAEQQRP
jgi:hypothetical protein